MRMASWTIIKTVKWVENGITIKQYWHANRLQAIPAERRTIFPSGRTTSQCAVIQRKLLFFDPQISAVKHTHRALWNSILISSLNFKNSSAMFFFKVSTQTTTTLSSISLIKFKKNTLSVEHQGPMFCSLKSFAKSKISWDYPFKQHLATQCHQWWAIMHISQWITY